MRKEKKHTIKIIAIALIVGVVLGIILSYTVIEALFHLMQQDELKLCRMENQKLSEALQKCNIKNSS